MGTPSDLLAGADLLDEAADEIEVCGWYQGVKTDLNGGSTFTAGAPCCPVSAMARLGGGGMREAHMALVNVIAPDDLAFELPVWNDTQDDPWVVLDAMRQAARNLRILYESVASWRSA